MGRGGCAQGDGKWGCGRLPAGEGQGCVFRLEQMVPVRSERQSAGGSGEGGSGQAGGCSGGERRSGSGSEVQGELGGRSGRGDAAVRGSGPWAELPGRWGIGARSLRGLVDGQVESSGEWPGLQAVPGGLARR